MPNSGILCEFGGSMKTRTFLGWFSHFPILRLAALLAAALAWSSSGLCGPIHDAAQQDDLAKVTALLDANPRLVFSKDDNGDTPLHVAARAGHRDVAELLLDRKAEINAKDTYGDTP